MGEPEIICLSSDEDEVICPPGKKNITTLEHEAFPDKMKIEKRSDISDSNKLESETCNKVNSSLKKSQNNGSMKCKESSNSISLQLNSNTLPSKDKICGNVEKKRKVSAVEEPHVVAKKSKPSNPHTEGESEENNAPELLAVNNSLLQTKKDSNNVIAKPQLIMKEKKSVTPVNQDIFPMFISLCLQKDRSPDMEVIVNKLKRNYEEMDLEYARSEDFTKLLNEKREAIASGRGIYVCVLELNSYMKLKRKGNVHKKRENGKKDQPFQQPLLCSANNVVENVELNAENEVAEEEHSKERRRINKKVRKIIQAMHKCEKVIKKLEEEEVDFNEEKNSSYIKLERYKERMVELYNMYCKLTGENADAGRPYLRPKHFSSTQIVVVDQTITKFVNSEIMKRNKIKSTGALTNALIFPDYMDILQCVSNCNDAHNLGLSKRKQGQIAKKAFIELGEHLQRVRQQDYWDTFSLFLEKREEDPAIKNSELAEKLKKNRQEGEQKMKELFEEYVKKQENFVETASMEEENDNDNEDEEKDSPEEELEIIEEIVGDAQSDSRTNANAEEAKSKRRESKDEMILEKSSPTKQNVCKSPAENNVNEVTEVVDNRDVKITENKIFNTMNNSIAVTEDKDTDDIIEITELKESDSKEVKNNSLDSKKPGIETEVQLSHDVGETKEYQPLIKVRSFATSPSTWEDGTDKSSVLQELSLAERYGEGHQFADNIIIQTNYKHGSENSVQKTYTIKVLPSTSSGKKKTNHTPAPNNQRKNLVRVKSICSINNKKAYITELNWKHKETNPTQKGGNNVSVKPSNAPKTSMLKIVDIPQNLNPARPLTK